MHLSCDAVALCNVAVLVIWVLSQFNIKSPDNVCSLISYPVYEAGRKHTHMNYTITTY